VSKIPKTLVAPHRRGDGGPRFLERGAVLGYRSGGWLIGHLPETFARGLLRWGLRATYSLWPSKRRYVNANFARVLGLEPDGPEVRRAAMAAYGNYARYLVELMRLPGLDDVAAYDLVDTANLLPLEEYWRDTRRGLILTTAHMGNLEGVARGVARHGWPIAGLADDTAFPELFDHLRRQRESWGVKIIPWRNLRALFGVLRRKEVLALLVDWGYRPDGIPVRLFGAWTTLPAGPAVLAAKTGAAIVHIAIRRAPDGRRFLVTHGDPIDVPSDDPADLARATQAVADALEAAIAAAPDQWYSFKPLWPSTREEEEALAERAAAMLTGPPADPRTRAAAR
jgi:KDO2-lipid IV(A) lauroyltransferase